MPAIDVGEVDFVAALQEAGEGDVVELFDEVVVVTVAARSDVQAADAFIFARLAGVDGYELAGSAGVAEAAGDGEGSEAECHADFDNKGGISGEDSAVEAFGVGGGDFVSEVLESPASSRILRVE